MKNLVVLYSLTFLLAIVSLTGQAQSEREFLVGGDQPLRISGFVGLGMEISSLENEVVPGGAAGLAVVFNQTFYAGFYGAGTIKRLDKAVDGFEEVDLAFGHGGLWLGYIHQSEQLIHPGLSLKIGGGGVYLAEGDGNEYIFEENNRIDDDALFVLNPQAELEINVAPWMKVNLGLGYRFVSDVDTPYLSQDDLNSLTGNLSFYLGWFQP